MRIWVVVFILIIFYALVEEAVCFSRDTIEISLGDKEIALDDFRLGGFKVKGRLSFSLKRHNGSLELDLEGKDLVFDDKSIEWFKMSLSKLGDVVFVRRFSLPQFNLKGEIDLSKHELTLNMKGSWDEESDYLEGRINMDAKAWGGVSDFFVSGFFIVNEGRYKDDEFSRLRIDFLGKPPLLNITDSEIVLIDGSVIEIEGALDLRDSSNIMPNAQFAVRKLFLGDWQLFSEVDNGIGLKRHIDDKFDVVLNADEAKDDMSGPGTELRYNLQDNKFLKFKMEDDKTVLKLERRRDF